MSDPRTNEYLSFLAERNRQKKIKNAKSKKELEDEEKERGFSTHFRGANATKARFGARSGNSYPSKLKTANSVMKKGDSMSMSPNEKKSEAADRRTGWGSGISNLHDSLDGKLLEMAIAIYCRQRSRRL